mgnify:CR=1 FL=1
MNSGYIIIDFGGLDLTSQSKVTVTGILNQVKAALATGKPIIAGNFEYSDKPCTPVSVMVCQDAATATSYDVFVDTLKIVVDKDDGCTITDLTT